MHANITLNGKAKSTVIIFTTRILTGRNNILKANFLSISSSIFYVTSPLQKYLDFLMMLLFAQKERWKDLDTFKKI
jgi:hypothetical protein